MTRSPPQCVNECVWGVKVKAQHKPGHLSSAMFQERERLCECPIYSVSATQNKKIDSEKETQTGECFKKNCAFLCEFLRPFRIIWHIFTNTISSINLNTIT